MWRPTKMPFFPYCHRSRPVLPSSRRPVEPRHYRKSNPPADHDTDQLGGSPTSRSGWTQIHRREWRKVSEDEAKERRQGWVFGRIWVREWTVGRIWVREWTLNARPELGIGMDDRFSAVSRFNKAGSLDGFGYPAGPSKPTHTSVGLLDLRSGQCAWPGPQGCPHAVLSRDLSPLAGRPSVPSSSPAIHGSSVHGSFHLDLVWCESYVSIFFS